MSASRKIAWLVVVGSVLLMIWLRRGGNNRNELKEWLDSKGLSEFEKPLRRKGIQSVQDVLKIDDHQLSTLKDVSGISELKAAVRDTQLTEWLDKKGLLHVKNILWSHGVLGLADLQHLDQEKADDIVKDMQATNDHHNFLSSVKLLKEELVPQDEVPRVRYGGVVVLLILLIAFLFLVSLYLFCGRLLEAVSLAIVKMVSHIILSVIFAVLKAIFQKFFEQIRFSPTSSNSILNFFSHSSRNASLGNTSRNSTILTGEFKLGLYDRITGRNLDISKSAVTWNHLADTEEVGGSSVATVKFHCRNGSPYKLQASDNLHICVKHSVSNNIIPHVVEPSAIVGSDVVKISFTTRLSGEYTIDIKLNGTRVRRDGPIKRHYKPGPVDSEKTVFLQQSNTVVVTAGLYHSMEIIPKDCFGNVAIISQQHLTAEIRKGGPSGDAINPECVVDRGGGVNRYEILLKVESPGHFVGCVKYKGSVIGPPTLNIISLTESDSSTVDKNVAKKCNVYYEAQLHTHGGGSKPKRVFCYPSSKQLQIREYYLLGIIPRRLYTCKVCPQTRIIFHDKDESFTIDDGYQSPVVLSSSHREVLAATFYKFLLKNIGGSEKFQDKQIFFYGEVKKLKNYRIRGEISFTIARDNILENFMTATKNLSTSDWFKKFSITFQGEEGLDWGGVSRELFQLLCVRCFDPPYKLFKRFSDNPQSLVHPNPKRPAHLKLKYYELAGRIVGKCLYESALGQPLMVKARFSRSFLAQIIGLRMNHKYFESDIPELYTTKIQYIRDNDVSDLGLVFAEEEFETPDGSPVIVPLIDRGEEIEVTNTNKLQYLNLLAQYKLAKCVKEEVEYFLKGLNEIIPENLLSIFDENELELLMCGMETVSFNDLKIHTVVNGSSTSFKEVVEWFWSIVSTFTQEEMAKLIQFVTGCSQLPPGGFKDLHPPFQIISSPTHGRLPTAHTCFNQICLPSYDSFEQFQQSLNLAIHEGSEGFGFA